jgi:hypothetical protein
LFKFLIDRFRAVFFKFFNLFPGCEFIGMITDDPAIDPAYFGRTDRAYFLRDKQGRLFIAIIEFESSKNEKKAFDFLGYAANFLRSRGFIMDPNESLYVEFVVIYSGTFSLPSGIVTDIGKLIFGFDQIAVRDYINGQEVLAKYKLMAESDSIPCLEPEDMLILSLAPLVMGENKAFCRQMVSLANSLAKNRENILILRLVVLSVCHILGADEIRKLLGAWDMEILLDQFFDGKYSAALKATASAKQEAASARAKQKLLSKKIAIERAEKAVLAEKIAVAEEKAALAEKEVAFAKKKDRELVISLYNEKVALGTISHCTGLSIDEIETIVSNK